MRISDWSSDVCSSDLNCFRRQIGDHGRADALSRFHQPVPVPAALHGRPPLSAVRNLKRARPGGVIRRAFLLEGAICPVRRRRADISNYPSSSGLAAQIGRASCRERVCQYVEISVVAVALKKKQTKNKANSARNL